MNYLDGVCPVFDKLDNKIKGNAMKLYDSIGPNPHIVRMFMAEKGIKIPSQTIDILAGENRKPPYNTSVSLAGQLPALEADDGSIISEITVICDYLEDIHPSPALIGSTPEQKAETRMWLRRLDLNICEPMANGFRAAEGRRMFDSRIKLVSVAGAADLKAVAKDRLNWLSAMLDGRTYICGERLSLADLHLFGFLKFGAEVGQDLTNETSWTKAWYDRIKARPSAAA